MSTDSTTQKSSPSLSPPPGGFSLSVLKPATAGSMGQPAVFTPVAHGHHHHQDGIACACGHDHSSEEGHSHSGVGLDFQLTVLLPLAIAFLVLAEAFAWLGGNQAVANVLGLLATAIAGGPIIWSAIKGLSKGQTNVNELVAMSIIGAISLGWYVEAGLVALILQIGALIEGVATESAQKAVAELQKLAPRHARVKHGDGTDKVVPIEQLRIGDTLVVQPGERIAADGKLLTGTTSVDESSVTGESVPVDKSAGAEMLAGTINLTGSAEVSVERVGEHSTLGHTIELVRRAQRFQPQIIRAADKFFAFYTPIILIASVIAWIVTKDPVRMVTMWVVGCPCAMLLASPLAIVVSLARASRSGIQVKAGPFVEASAALKTVVFDKTGTLTTGKFIVSNVRPVEGISADELLRLAATIEQRSSHPLARSLVAHGAAKGITPGTAADMQVLEGLGVRAHIDGKDAAAGSLKIVPPDQAARATQLGEADESLPVVPVYVVVDGRLLGAIYLTDEIRPEAARTISRLRALGIQRVAMLTGDRKRTAELVARAVGCDETFAELLPGEKVQIIRNLQRGGRAVCMVGDGINDAPSLATATVGVAMGVRGTDVAIEAADAVLLKDDLSRLPLLIYLAKRTRMAIFQNLMVAVAFSGIAEAAAAAGLLNPVTAAIAHILGVVVIAMNSVRLAGGRVRRPAAEDIEEPTELPQTPTKPQEPFMTSLRPWAPCRSSDREFGNEHMKRAEQMAWAALAGLIVVFTILLSGAIIYHFTAFWTGALFAAGQAVAVGLAAWGLALARQARDLIELDPAMSRSSREEPAGSGFRMSMGDDGPSSPRASTGKVIVGAAAGRLAGHLIGGHLGGAVGGLIGAATANRGTDQQTNDDTAQTLDTGFQRLVVGIAAAILLGLGAIAGTMLYNIWRWTQLNPNLTLSIVGPYPTETAKTPHWMDELGLVIGLAAAAVYAILYWITRPKRGNEEYAEATTSTFTLGIAGFVALAAATLLAYFHVVYASEVAAGIITALMLLQGLELLVNACRSYSSIEELDQEAVDLQALPLVPMLSSVWLQGLRLLFASSVGFSGKAKHERGVMARMMPRALAAIAVIGVIISCLRVVAPGEVAVLERLGYAPTDAQGRLLPEAILKPGLHLTMPWPIDQLVPIPTERLQMTSVGTELHTNPNWKGVDFEFWTVRDDSTPETDIEDLFATGDPNAPQILETFVNVQWRVTDPAAFYSTLSHSETFEKGKGAEGTQALPIYEAIVKQATSFAVTRTFAIHSLEQVMIGDRKEVENHCREILQAKLDTLGKALNLPSSGITVEYLTIKDMHPPYGHPDRPNDPTQPVIGGIATPTPTGIRIDPDPNGRSQVSRGPASAFEFVISMREFKEQMMALARGQVTAQMNEATGIAESSKKQAEAYRLDKVARAHADADRLLKIIQGLNPADQKRVTQIMKQRLFYDTIRDLFDPVNKILVDPDVKDIQIYQNTEKGPLPLVPQ